MSADIHSTLQSIIELLVAALLPLIAFVIHKASEFVQAKTHLNLKQYEGLVNEKLDQVLQRAAEQALHKLEDKGVTDVNTQSAALKAAIDFANKAIPDTLKSLGVTPEHLSDMIRARLYAATPAPVVELPPTSPSA